MMMMVIDSESNTNIRAYEILRPLTKNENFSAYKQGFMNFMLMTVVLSETESLPGMSFRRAYSTC
jgi:hypothetical protein